MYLHYSLMACIFYFFLVAGSNVLY